MRFVADLRRILFLCMYLAFGGVTARPAAPSPPRLIIRGVISFKGVPYFVGTDTHHIFVIKPLVGTRRFKLVEGSEAWPVLAQIERTYSGECMEYVDLRIPEKSPLRFGPQGEFRWSPGRGIVKHTTKGDFRYPLPQINREEFNHRRPEMAHDHIDFIDDAIGPYQLVDSHLWFGESFSDAEGNAGVGGFGYFDTESGAFLMFSPHQVWPWSASALLVEPDAVWLGLVHNYEKDIVPGGLLRWDRRTHNVNIYSVPSIINVIASVHDGICLGTMDGLVEMGPGGSFKRYTVMKGVGGKYRLVESSFH